MGWRGPTALAALVLLGVALGYGASLASAPASTTSGVAEPVVVKGPTLPLEEQDRRAPDPTDAPLLPGVPLERVTLGSERFAVSFLAPDGWTRIQRAPDEIKWKEPGTSNNTYVLAVQQVTSRRLTIEQSKEAALVRLEADQDQFEPQPSAPDSLAYTYVSDEGTLRYSFIRWVAVLRGDQADVEVVVHGRERDVPGTRDLADRVAASVTTR